MPGAGLSRLGQPVLAEVPRDTQRPTGQGGARPPIPPKAGSSSPIPQSPARVPPCKARVVEEDEQKRETEAQS